MEEHRALDVVLSKEEIELLQIFHRVVPLPALTSKILRIVCEDDATTAFSHSLTNDLNDDEDDDDDEEDVPEDEHPEQDEDDEEVVRASQPRIHQPIPSTAVKHSPLTRRLSQSDGNNPTKPQVPRKPHVSVDLSQFTARIASSQQLS